MDETPPSSPQPDEVPPNAAPPSFPPPPEHGAPRWNEIGSSSDAYGARPPAHYPMDLGRILSLTFSLFRFRWRTFVGVSLVVMVPLTLADAAIQLLTIDSVAQSTEAIRRAALGRELPLDALISLVPWPALAISWLASAVIGLVAVLSTAAVTHAAAEAYRGGNPTVRSSLRASIDRLGVLAVIALVVFVTVIALILVGVGLGAGLFAASYVNGSVQPGPLPFLGLIVLVAMVVIAVVIGLRWAVAIPEAMIQNTDASTALRRSWHLMAGSMWRVFGYSVVIGIIVGIPAGVLSYVVNVVIGSGVAVTATGVTIDPVAAFGSTATSGLITAVVAPISAIAVTILYFDIRWRKGESVPEPGGAIAIPRNQVPG